VIFRHTSSFIPFIPFIPVNFVFLCELCGLPSSFFELRRDKLREAAFGSFVAEKPEIATALRASQ